MVSPANNHSVPKTVPSSISVPLKAQLTVVLDLSINPNALFDMRGVASDGWKDGGDVKPELSLTLRPARELWRLSPLSLTILAVEMLTSENWTLVKASSLSSRQDDGDERPGLSKESNSLEKSLQLSLTL